jgi:hypothetical protein
MRGPVCAQRSSVSKNLTGRPGRELFYALYQSDVLMAQNLLLGWHRIVPSPILTAENITMKTYLKSSLAALAVGLLAHAPAESAVVFTYQNGLSCGTLSLCSIGTDGNLSESSQLYSTVAGFDSQFARGTAITAFLDGLPTHTTVGIDFLLAVIDSWDGLTPSSCAGHLRSQGRRHHRILGGIRHL